MSAQHEKKKEKRKKEKAEHHKDKGNQVFARGEYIEAIKEFTAAIDLDDSNHVYYSNRAATYAKLEKWDESEADAKKCVALKPDFVKGWGRLGYAQFTKGSAEEALASYKAGLAIDAKDKTCADGLLAAEQYLVNLERQKKQQAVWAAEAEAQRKDWEERKKKEDEEKKAQDEKDRKEYEQMKAKMASAMPAEEKKAEEKKDEKKDEKKEEKKEDKKQDMDPEYLEFLEWKRAKKKKEHKKENKDSKDRKDDSKDEKKQEEYAIGIDLGTTYSCVGVWKNDKVEIIPNVHGSRTTPSYVALLPDGTRHVGQPAKSRQAMFPHHVLYDIKRIIGQRLTDYGVEKDIRHFPFKIVEAAGGSPLIQVDYEDKSNKQFTPESISAMVLQEMKSVAEQYLGVPVRKAVITVPAYFNDSQRNATKAAGAIAGLEVLRIINEPTAAALSYGLDLASLGKKKRVNVLIFDLGGGTFDVSVLSIEGGIFEVKATGGDTHLGGEDFDHASVMYLLEEAKKAGCPGDLTKDQRALKRLREAAERAKRALSDAQVTDIHIPALSGEWDFNHQLTRQRFNELNKEFFTRCIDTVKYVMKDAKMKPEDIDEVVLVGGSTRIPKVQELLSKYFGGKELCKGVNPDEAVAYGATVQAAILAGQRNNATKDVLLMDVTPLSLGIETVGRVMSVIIPRNTPIPCVRTQTYTTEENYQTAVDVCVYEGERLKTTDNNLLGKFTISGIERAKRGEPQVDVSFALDSDGILKVSAVDKKTGAEAHISIQNRTNMRKDDLDKLVKEAEKFRKEDEDRLKKVEVRNDFERLINEMMEAAEEMMAGDIEAELAGKKPKKGVSKKKSEEQKKFGAALRQAAEKAQEWLDAHPDAKAGEIALQRRLLEKKASSSHK